MRSLAPPERPTLANISRFCLASRTMRIRSLTALLVPALLRAAEFHVSPTGQDQSPGSADQPFRTAARAVDAARDGTGNTIVFTVGRHELAGTLVLDGTTNLTLRAAAPGKVTLAADTPVPAGAFQPVKDPTQLSRLPAAARPHARSLDLRAAGIPAVKSFPDAFSDQGGLFDFYVNGERPTLARWPNAGEAVMARVLEKGALKRAKDAPGGTFVAHERRIARWADAAREGRLWLSGFWQVPWTTETLKVASIHAASNAVSFAVAASGGLGSKYAGPEGSGAEPWHAVNLIEELDQPGEWAVDFATQTLLWWPPQALEKLEISIASRTDPLVRAKDASGLVLQGLVLEGGAGNRVELQGGSGCRIEACDLRRLGKDGVVIKGGTRHLVLSCDLHELGAAGIVAGGGDRATLTPAGHVLRNNHIWRFGRTKKMYAPGIALGSYGANPAVGCVVAHNRIHDAPHAGILYGGNDHVLEYNEIYDIAQESDDVGAFYSWRDWTSYGNIVRYNFVHHAPRVTGVYVDDGDSGDRIEGNLFYRTMCGPFVGGGHDNLVLNNLAVVCGRGAHLDGRGVPRGYASSEGHLKPMADFKVTQPPWSDRYPSLATLGADHPEIPRGNVFERTVSVACESNLHYGDKPKEGFPRCRLENNHSLPVADLGFVDPGNLDFRMKPDAAVFTKVPGFQPLPFERMGLQVDALRRVVPAREPAFSRAFVPTEADSKAFGEVVKLDSPLWGQVFQRDAANQARVRLAGVYGLGVDTIRYRITGQPTQGELEDRTHDLAVDPNRGGPFATQVTLPAGGWYRLEAKALSGGQVIGEWKVDRFGVGEVLVVAGQSNAGNYGGEKLRTQTRRVSAFDGTRWHLAEDPLRGAGGGGGSFMPALGDLLAERLDLPVAVIPLAVGATSVREWLPKGTRMRQQPTTGQNVKSVGPGEWEATGALFDKLAARLSALGTNGCRAVLWHQGESDAGQARGGYPADRQITGAQYTEFMRALIDASRAQAGWPVPWVTAVTTYHSEADAADEEFRAAQKALWQPGLALPGPDTDALRKEFRDGVHFNGKGLREHARLWAEALAPMLPATKR